MRFFFHKIVGKKPDTASYCNIGRSQAKLNFRMIAFRFLFIAILFHFKHENYSQTQLNLSNYAL